MDLCKNSFLMALRRFKKLFPLSKSDWKRKAVSFFRFESLIAPHYYRDCRRKNKNKKATSYAEKFTNVIARNCSLISIKTIKQLSTKEITQGRSAYFCLDFLI